MGGVSTGLYSGLFTFLIDNDQGQKKPLSVIEDSLTFNCMIFNDDFLGGNIFRLHLLLCCSFWSSVLGTFIAVGGILTKCEKGHSI